MQGEPSLQPEGATVERLNQAEARYQQAMQKVMRRFSLTNPSWATDEELREADEAEAEVEALRVALQGRRPS